MPAATHHVLGRHPHRSSARLLAVAVLPLALLAGCGGSDDTAGPSASTSASTSATESATTPATAPSVTPSSPDSAPSTAAAAGKQLRITISGKQVSPPPGSFKLGVGEKLTLTVTSDSANELHVHGWNVEKELQPNQPTTIELVGKEAGTYEVETHDPELLLTKITVR